MAKRETKPYNFRFPPDLMEKAQDLANEFHRGNLTAYIEALIETDTKKRHKPKK